MKPLTLKIIDKAGVGVSADYLAMCRAEDQPVSGTTLGEGSTARAAMAEAMNAWFTRAQEAVEAAAERERATVPYQPTVDLNSVSEPILDRRVETRYWPMRGLLERAASGGHLVEIHYKSEGDTHPSSRKVTPQSVYTRLTASAPFSNSPDNTYCLATDRLTGQNKQYRLDRMARAELVG